MPRNVPVDPPKTVVVALGGNALALANEPATISNQFRHTRESLAPIVELARAGWNIALVHGNGPQIGDELIRNETSVGLVEPLPLGVLVAGTAGWIGYMIQQSLQNALRHAGIDRPVVTLVTQTEVDPADPQLHIPVKRAGHPLDADRAHRLEARGVPVKLDADGVHWHRLTVSPVPIGVVEASLVERLVGTGVIVIAAGGGGPPVYRDPAGDLEGVDGVVDKDRVSAVLARDLHAEVLIILTEADAVYRGWGTPSAAAIRSMTLAEADALLASGTLEKGSIAPKVEAGAAFVRFGGERAIIAKLSEGLAALEGRTGTTIVRT
ncbi:MAG TPA: carbamate kinase [Gemmatimonadales bacterium]|nr:carbamate kinase [Gemmatimonadales bacterium]